MTEHIPRTLDAWLASGDVDRETATERAVSPLDYSSHPARERALELLASVSDVAVALELSPDDSDRQVRERAARGLATVAEASPDAVDSYRKWLSTRTDGDLDALADALK